MDNIYIEEDDNTYIYGNNEFKGLKKDEKYIEPFYYENNNKIVKYYPSKNLFIEYKNNKIIEIIYTETCWSDDYSRYIFNDDILLNSEISYHGFNKIYITYKNNKIIDFRYNYNKFGNYSIGDDAGNFTKILKEYETI